MLDGCSLIDRARQGGAAIALVSALALSVGRVRPVPRWPSCRCRLCALGGLGHRWEWHAGGTNRATPPEGRPPMIGPVVVTCWVGWWACQGLEPETSSFSANFTQSGFPGWRQRPWNDVPPVTAAYRSVPHRVWPNHGPGTFPLAGAAALRLADLGWQGRPPPAAPDKRAPPGRSPC
jgi:hypothetical protein